jgi:cytochrome c-type biogenesis protein
LRSEFGVTMISILFALFAGVATIAAPCTLPILPVLLGTSLADHSKSRGLFVVLGFILSFAVVTIGFSLATRFFGLDPEQLHTVAIVLFAIFGVLLLWPQLYERLSLSMSAFTARIGLRHGRFYHGAAGGFVLGTTLGLVWTPCAGPVLGSILTLLATQVDLNWAALLLAFYAVGAAIPMLAISYGGQYVAQRVRSIASYTQRLQQAFGILVVGFATAMYFQYDTLLTSWLSNLYPTGQIGL